MACLYYYKGNWVVSSSTNEDIFWVKWNQLKYNFPTNTDIIYHFIYTKNLKKETNILFLGCSYVGEYIDIDSNYQLIHRKIFQYDNVEELVQHIDPVYQIGILVENDGMRKSILSPQYANIKKLKAIHKDYGKLEKSVMLNIARINDKTSFLEVFPEWEEMYFSVKHLLNEVSEIIDEAFMRIKKYSRQEFVTKAKKYSFWRILLQMKNYQQTCKECYSDKWMDDRAMIKNIRYIFPKWPDTTTRVIHL
eukprot:TRINITY_DN3291_c0_g1_i1.p1 TRINITY_DN3291_c0_g1~~TRINITY_DN3291_c0_g1_i1.p1  ORF type:complete len:249 (+),score=38.87 TRINITY_DN3291_c0_g1_i1:973-1719(+)